MRAQEQDPDPENPKVYLLPNLMTAGNLFCGFMAVLQIMEGMILQSSGEPWEGRYRMSIYWIFGAFVFDFLDGRLARLEGRESAFGREFDSIADIVSFGVAPALLMFKIVLAEMPRNVGWVVAFLYLLCGALRLARFNVAEASGHARKGEFNGFPIPAAAALICSITLLLLHLYDTERNIGRWRYLLPVLMVFLSLLMFSNVRYPSFKRISWRTRRSVPILVLIIVGLVLVVQFKEVLLAPIFVGYLLYGLARQSRSAPSTPATPATSDSDDKAGLPP